MNENDLNYNIGQRNGSENNNIPAQNAYSRANIRNNNNNNFEQEKKEQNNLPPTNLVIDFTHLIHNDNQIGNLQYDQQNQGNGEEINYHNINPSQVRIMGNNGGGLNTQERVSRGQENLQRPDQLLNEMEQDL